MDKTRTIREIEEKMSGLEPESLRFQVLQALRKFKGNWIELGCYVNQVQRSQSFKAWGYPTFEIYCARELKLRQQTASKLVCSYLFLKKEEPVFLESSLEGEGGPGRIPDFESVNILRRARSRKRISPEDYARMREAVFESEVPSRELSRQYRGLLEAARSDEADPQDAQSFRRETTVKKILASLRSIKVTLEETGYLSSRVVENLKKIIQQIEEEFIRE